MPELVEKAREIATRAHEGQRRKDGPAYILHPTAVAHTLQTEGFSEAVIAAAYVHDVLEDTSYPREKLFQELGQEVLSIVDAVTEEKSLPWRERKERYIESVRMGPEGAKAVATADKINNLEDFLGWLSKDGENVWAVFGGKESKLWFEESMLEALGNSWRHPLLERYGALVSELRNLAGSTKV